MPVAVSSVDVPNLLLGLAWLGELDRLQIQRLWFVGKSVSTVEKTLARLHNAGLISRRGGSVRDEQRGVTVPQLARWSLTPAGHSEIEGYAQYPASPAASRGKHLFAHDTRATAAIVRLIELGQHGGLSGVFVAHELRLNPAQRRPVCDALVVLQFGAFGQPNLVPWSSDPATTDEGRLRFAIEADNSTEPLAVLAGKATTYRKLVEDRTWVAWWQQQHGPLPVPLWVAPTKERALAIHREWKRAWPTGEWLVTSDEGLERNELLKWKEQRERTISFSFGMQQSAPPAEAASSRPTPQEEGFASTTPTAVPVQPALAAPSAQPPAPIMKAPAPTASQVSTQSTTPLAVPAIMTGGSTPHSDRRRFVTSQAKRGWPGSLRERLLRTASTLRKLLWRDSEPLEALRNAALTASIVLAASFAGVAVGSPTKAAEEPPRTARATAQVVGATTFPPPVEAPTLTSACRTVRVTAKDVNLRPSPGTGNLPIRKLRLDERLTVRDCRGEPADGFLWWEVEGEDGMRGWVATTWLEEAR